MSWKDTIDGAMKEATDGGFAVPGPKRGEEVVEEPAAETKRSQRGSAARAKPVRERAGSVRIETSSPDGGKNRALASKEEKKAIRQKERDREDLSSAAAGVLQKRDGDYQRSERLFWVLMVVGFAATVFSMLLNSMSLPIPNQAAVSVVLLVVAYVFIIGAFVFDLVKRNPMRKKFNEKVASMSESKRRALVEEDMAEKAAKKAAKAKK